MTARAILLLLTSLASLVAGTAFADGFTRSTKWHGYFSIADETPLTGDFNGDGIDDVVTLLHEQAGARKGEAWVALSDGTGHFVNSKAWSGYACPDSSMTCLTGDVDGNGLDDIIQFNRNAPGFGKGQVYVNRASQNGLFFRSNITGIAHTWMCVDDKEQCIVGDFNGDGLADIGTVLNGSYAPSDWRSQHVGRVYVALSNGLTFGKSYLWMDVGFSGPGQTVRVGDFNGNGTDDLVNFNQPANTVFIALSTGSSFLVNSTPSLTSFCRPGRLCDVGDFDGDGLADIVGFVGNSASGTAAGDAWVALKNPDFADMTFKTPFAWHGRIMEDGDLPLIGHVNRDEKDDVVRFFRGTPGRVGDVYTALTDMPSQPVLTEDPRFGFDQAANKWTGDSETIPVPIIQMWNQTLNPQLIFPETPAQIRSRLFSQTNPTSNLTKYYQDVSNGQIQLVADIAIGPFLWPFNFNANTIPSRATRILGALAAVDSAVNFAAYDVGDGVGGSVPDGIIQGQEMIVVEASEERSVFPPGTVASFPGASGAGAWRAGCVGPSTGTLEGGTLQVGACGYIPGLQASFEVHAHEMGHLLGEFGELYSGPGGSSANSDRGSMMGTSSGVSFGISSKYMDPASRQVAGWQAPRVAPLIQPGTCELLTARHVPGVAPIMLYDQRRGFTDQFYIEAIRNLPLAGEPVSDYVIDDPNNGSGVHLWYASLIDPSGTNPPFYVYSVNATDVTSTRIITSWYTYGSDGTKARSSLWGDQPAQTLSYHDGASARLRFRTSSVGPYAEWGFRRLPPANVFLAPSIVDPGDTIGLIGKFGISQDGAFPREVVLREHQDASQFKNGQESEITLPVVSWRCDVLTVTIPSGTPPGSYQIFVREEHEFAIGSGTGTRFTHGSWAPVLVSAAP